MRVPPVPPVPQQPNQNASETKLELHGFALATARYGKLLSQNTQKATRQIWTNVAKEPNELPQILKPRRTV